VNFGLPDGLAAGYLDSVICLNVLEHVERDEEALRSFHQSLQTGGKLILLVPAGKSLFGSLDVSFKHCRRYDRQELFEKLTRAGFKVKQLRYFNFIGCVGWYLNGKIFRRKTLPAIQLRLFDWLVPLFKLEEKIGIPFGVSLIAIAEKG
jgi:SAM-dependent methyltransferase